MEEAESKDTVERERETYRGKEKETTENLNLISFISDVMNLSRVPDDYDYDMEASHNTFFWDELLPTLTVYCLTFVSTTISRFLLNFFFILGTARWHCPAVFRFRHLQSVSAFSLL